MLRKAIIFALFCAGCGEVVPDISNLGQIKTDSLHLRTEANEMGMDSMRVRALFAKMPTDWLQAEGLRTINKNIRQELLEQGHSAPFRYKQAGLVLELSEDFQSEDDSDERTDAVRMVFFGEAGQRIAGLMLLEIERSRELGSLAERPKAWRFWQHDGRDWSETTMKTPWPSQDMFYEEGEHLATNKNNGVYAYYTPEFPDRLFLTLEIVQKPPLYTVFLQWKDSRFELHQQPAGNPTANQK